jgi:hypothetical protein
MLSHGVARLRDASDLCGIMREELPACKTPAAEAPAIAVETKQYSQGVGSRGFGFALKTK